MVYQRNCTQGPTGHMIKALWLAQPGQLGQGQTIGACASTVVSSWLRQRASVFSYKRSLNMAEVDSARRVTLFARNNTPYKRGPSLRYLLFNTVLQLYILKRRL